MREGTELHLNKIFKHIGIRLDVLKVEKEMLKRLEIFQILKKEK